MTRVKICGLSDPDQARAAAESGADYVGVILAPSRRRVTEERAAEIVRTVRQTAARPETVGVFVNEDVANLNRLARAIGLDRIQLSGDEDYGYCHEVDHPLAKVLRIEPGETALSVAKRLEEGARSLAGRDVLWLLDTGGAGAYGGTGARFDWQAATLAAGKARVLVAGGLTPGNVPDVIREVRPFGVDVASGVETDGRTDTAKVAAFIRAVRQADAS